jgi:KipI family sensor histidine kinase inhibitor
MSQPFMPGQLRPVGDRAFLVDLPDLATVHRLHAAIRTAVADGRLPGVVDVVPAYRTVLVVLDGAVAPAPVADAVRALPLPPAAEAQGRLVEVPVAYDGPDLAEVCARTGLALDELIERHAAPAYLVAFLGFTPGFPYLVGLDPALHVPRRASPRTRVPAGAVGLAGDQTGVYSRESPGGWQLIGHTDVVLFDPFRTPPALLAPGDRLRFVPVP